MLDQKVYMVLKKKKKKKKKLLGQKRRIWLVVLSSGLSVQFRNLNIKFSTFPYWKVMR